MTQYVRNVYVQEVMDEFREDCKAVAEKFYMDKNLDGARQCERSNKDAHYSDYAHQIFILFEVLSNTLTNHNLNSTQTNNITSRCSYDRATAQNLGFERKYR